MSAATKRFLADTVERAARTFAQAYLACWLAIEPSYERLFTRSNWEAGVVGVALSVALSVGAKRRGADDSASLLPANVDPPQRGERGATDLAYPAVVVACTLVAVFLLLRYA